MFFPFACGYFLSFMLRNINAVAFPELVAAFGLGPDALGVLTSAYFLGFALFQIPLGMLLDRYGPRRTNSALLLVAAGGVFVFASATELTMLVAGRALMGVGFAGCLMSSMTAFLLWFERARMATLSGWMLAVGACGALAATAPVEIALRTLDWRTLFFTLAVLVVAAGFVIRWRVPERRAATAAIDWRAQFQGLAAIYAARDFWRIALLAAITQAGALALLGLWAGPWLRDVAGLERAAIGQHLSIAAVSFGLGGVVFGTLSERLARRGVSVESTYLAGCGATALALLPLALGITLWPALTWCLFIACAAAGTLAYAVLTARFPAELTGRVLTAVNVLTMACAFAFQAGVGAVIGVWTAVDGRYAAQGYRAAFGVVLLLQVGSLLWAVRAARWQRRRPG